MSNLFFEHPILNSPYDYPSRHWEPDEQGQPTQRIINQRRKAEFITPIPEGNGRRGRLLSILMALQAGLPLLDFSEFEQERRQEYFAAVQHGMDRNYRPMEKVFSDVIIVSLQKAGD